MSKCCDNCEVRKAYAKQFDMHWFNEDDCPVVCAMKGKTTDNDFGTALGQLIAGNGISMRELERKSGVSREAIRRWICGMASARIELAECVLEVLGYKLEVTPCNR